jgi:hypothetical protein
METWLSQQLIRTEIEGKPLQISPRELPSILSQIRNGLADGSIRRDQVPKQLLDKLDGK